MELPARASKANVEDQKESVKPNSAKFKGLHKDTISKGVMRTFYSLLTLIKTVLEEHDDLNKILYEAL
jgi:hypothetical protein